MKLFSILLFPLAFFSINALAEEIVYCPEVMVCEHSVCTSSNASKSYFYKYYNVNKKDVNGTLYFAGAQDGTSDLACFYEQDGIRRATLLNNGKPLKAATDVPGNEWIYVNPKRQCGNTEYNAPPIDIHKCPLKPRY